MLSLHNTSPAPKRTCCHDRYDEAGAAASRITELRAAEAVRLKGLLTSAHQAELAQIQGNFQQVCLCLRAAPACWPLVTNPNWQSPRKTRPLFGLSPPHE